MKLLSLFFLSLTLSLTFSLSPCANASSLTTNEIFVRLQSVIEDNKGFDALLTDLESLDDKQLISLLKEFDQTWPQVRDSYLKAYQAFLKTEFTGSKKNNIAKEIRKHRSDFMAIYRLAEGPMKPLLKKTSMPALKALEKLIMPNIAKILANAPPQLSTQRKIALILAKFRDAIVDTAVLYDQEPAEEKLIAAEKESLSGYSGLPRAGLRIIAENDKIAEKEKIPADEREGIREVNLWRILLGLNALVIDPKLSNACRTHSEDMAKLGFFAHDSPVPGRASPWDRAAEAGTKSTGENIYMGSSSPASANSGWFFSPGHHKNMFKSGHKYIGLGRYQSHWTQMFG